MEEEWRWEGAGQSLEREEKKSKSLRPDTSAQGAVLAAKDSQERCTEVGLFQVFYGQVMGDEPQCVAWIWWVEGPWVTWSTLVKQWGLQSQAAIIGIDIHRDFPYGLVAETHVIHFRYGLDSWLGTKIRHSTVKKGLKFQERKMTTVAFNFPLDDKICKFF